MKILSAIKICVDWILLELIITYRLFISNALGFYASFAINVIAWYIFNKMPLIQLLRAVLHSTFVGSILCITFEYANQTFHAKEDKVNKPYRPIPSGLLTESGAFRRFIFSWTFSPILGYYIYGVEMFVLLLLWELTMFYSHVWVCPKGWLFKTVHNAFACSQIQFISDQTLKVVVEGWEMFYVINVIIGVWFLLSNPIQDFLDEKGDAVEGRKTLPLILSPRGEVHMKRIISSIFVLSALGTFFWTLCYCTRGPGFDVLVKCGLFQIAVATILAKRVLFSKSRDTDWENYHYFYYPALVLFSIQCKLNTLTYAFGNQISNLTHSTLTPGSVV